MFLQISTQYCPPRTARADIVVYLIPRCLRGEVNNTTIGRVDQWGGRRLLPKQNPQPYGRMDWTSYCYWPPRSPDLTPSDFFLWDYVKDTVYRSPLPHDLQELRQRIITAVTTIEEDLLEKVWQELDYRLEVCRVTWDALIKCL
jgi:hypothetical protein